MNASLKYDRTGNHLELRDGNGAMTISAGATNTELSPKKYGEVDVDHFIKSALSLFFLEEDQFEQILLSKVLSML